jgi:uncharacterized protein (DUF1330 family)
MAVYAVVNVQITDPDRYTEYRGKAQPPLPAMEAST